jgi:hypothetical protein
VLYYANPCSEEVKKAMSDGLLGFIDTPKQGNKHVPGADWCADNGCFSSKWESDKWWKWVTKFEPTMRFACCPDVVGDWDATRKLYDLWSDKMRAEKLPVACVAQDGAVIEEIDWENISCVFIGGSTEWKLSPDSEKIIRHANKQKVWAHVGRVNSLRRIRWATQTGADSVDGTHITFGPTTNLKKVLKWLEIVNSEQSLRFDVSSR